MIEALKNGDARFFPSDALLDNYTRLNIDNFGLNLSSKDVKLKTLFELKASSGVINKNFE